MNDRNVHMLESNGYLTRTMYCGLFFHRFSKDDDFVSSVIDARHVTCPVCKEAVGMELLRGLDEN